MRLRKIGQQISQYLKNHDKNVVFLWGPRQTGKSTILNQLRGEFGGAYFNFDDLTDRKLWTPELRSLYSAIGIRAGGSQSRFVFIDEVQNHPESTLGIKLLADAGKHVIIATGSSELRAKTHKFDTLAGRYKEFVLFPLTLDELASFLANTDQWFEQPDAAAMVHLSSFIPHMLLYGSYPKVTLSRDKIEELKLLARDSVVKDIVNIYELKNADTVQTLLKLLAMQIGNLVNMSELCSNLQTSSPTVSNYLSILERNRIIYFLEPLKANKRRGYLERKKVYFYDLGLRNAFVEDFRPLEVRSDTGALFENLVVLGFLRQTEYQRNQNKLYYFRQIGSSQKEVDLIVEDPDGKRLGLEIKYQGGKINQLENLGIERFEVLTKDTAARWLV